MYGNELTPLQDPHSDISLFLSKKIREQAASLTPTKEWSHYLQEKLIQTITPDFEKKFPESRLGAATVKRVWEKMNHLSELFQNQNEALKSDGKLNLHFLIRENLKQKRGISSHPFLVAQQLALKIGEVLASYEGVKPDLGHLTDLIWTSLSHLLPGEKLSLFKIKWDVKDRLILKWMVDVITTQPGIAYAELYSHLQNKLSQFQKFRGSFAQDIEQLTMEWASKLLPFTSFYQSSSSTAIHNLRQWVKQQLDGKTILEIKAEALKLHPSISLADLEVVIWSCRQEVRPSRSLSTLYKELLAEASSRLVYYPLEDWKTAATQAAHYLERNCEISKLGNNREWNQRIEKWASQGELALRFLEFPDSPLLHLARMHQQKSISFQDATLTIQLRERFLYRYSSPLIEPTIVHQMAEIIRKHLWYSLSSQDSTFTRWVQLQNRMDESEVRTKASRTFPLLPFTKP